MVRKTKIIPDYVVISGADVNGIVTGYDDTTFLYGFGNLGAFVPSLRRLAQRSAAKLTRNPSCLFQYHPHREAAEQHSRALAPTPRTV